MRYDFVEMLDESIVEADDICGFFYLPYLTAYLLSIFKSIFGSVIGFEYSLIFPLSRDGDLSL